MVLGYGCSAEQSPSEQDLDIQADSRKTHLETELAQDHQQRLGNSELQLDHDAQIARTQAEQALLADAERRVELEEQKLQAQVVEQTP